MRVLVIGGTGFIGTHIVRQLADQGHVVAIYHRGRTQAALPNHVHQILHPRSAMPIQKFPKKLFEFGPDVVRSHACDGRGRMRKRRSVHLLVIQGAWFC